MAKRGPKGPSKYTQEFISKEADALMEYAISSPLPFLNKFCVDRGYHTQRITENAWVRNEQFSEALKKAKNLLEYKLTAGTLAGKLNPAMAIFALKNVAGWRDVKEIKGEGFGGDTKIIIIRSQEKKENETEDTTQIIPRQVSV